VGRITLDEKFGSSKELRKQLIDQARQAQYEVYRAAQEKQSKKTVDVGPQDDQPHGDQPQTHEPQDCEACGTKPHDDTLSNDRTL
jgi:hypothetical protein